MYGATLGNHRYNFPNLATLLGKASPLRSGDILAGVAAQSGEERVAAQFALSDLPLRAFLEDHLISYESDEVTRLIADMHDAKAFAAISHLTVGGFRDWLLSDDATQDVLENVRPGVTPEMAAAVSKICRAQDLVLVAAKCNVITRFRSTVGLPGRLSVRLQPNHPTDDPRGIAASILDGLMLGAGDAVIGINPASDSPERAHALLSMLDEIRSKLDIPTQTCVLAHVTTTLNLICHGSPIDLVFQSIAGTEAANRSFGITLAMLEEAREAALSLRRGSVGNNVMYFETGQGSALSANAHHGIDQQTLEARAYAIARRFSPMLVNSVVGFIGPEYLFDGKQIIRAGLEDHLRQADGRADGCGCLLHQPCRSGSGRYGCATGPAGRGGREFRNGSAWRRRHYAGLSEHLIPRRTRHARLVWPAPGPRIRDMASVPGIDRHRGSHPTEHDACQFPRDVARLMTPNTHPSLRAPTTSGRSSRN